VLSQEALASRVEKWQHEVMQVQQVFVDYNKELQKKQNELMQPILGKVLGTVRRIATSEGYGMVIDKQAVPYVRNDLDLTDRTITAYNSGGAEPAAVVPATPPSTALPGLTPPTLP
jgi:outer membrane protein